VHDVIGHDVTVVIAGGEQDFFLEIIVDVHIHSLPIFVNLSRFFLLGCSSKKITVCRRSLEMKHMNGHWWDESLYGDLIGMNFSNGINFGGSSTEKYQPRQ